MSEKKVWFVTGASKGLGLALVKELLSEDFHVAATSRNLQSLIKEIGEKSEAFLPIEMDVTDNEDVKNAISKSVEHFGKVDVVVNNAGYGQTGALEELTDAECRKNFDVNVFGTLNVIRNIMPYLREQKSGHIFNISSVGGFTADFPGWGIYSATKFAVSALSESLAAETASFGIKVTNVYPGYFRTNFLSQESLTTPENTIEDYKEAIESRTFHQSEMDGNQSGDPRKAARVMIEISKQASPSVHLFLGKDAYTFALEKISTVQNDLEKNKALTSSTDFTETV